MAHKKSKAYKRFRARIRYFTERMRGKWLSPNDFVKRPHFDEYLGRPSGYTQWLDESTGHIWYIPIDRKAEYFARKNRQKSHSKDREPKHVIQLSERRDSRAHRSDNLDGGARYEDDRAA